jgi:tRNA(Ile)-lysidine synthase
MIQPGDAVAAAVSGGADSVALLEVLARLRERLGITLAVAHLDHRLRGGPVG